MLGLTKSSGLVKFWEEWGAVGHWLGVHCFRGKEPFGTDVRWEGAIGSEARQLVSTAAKSCQRFANIRCDVNSQGELRKNSL